MCSTVRFSSYVSCVFAWTMIGKLVGYLIDDLVKGAAAQVKAKKNAQAEVTPEHMYVC